MASNDQSEKREGGRLLVVSYHFPPDGAIGGLRWAGLTKFLEPLGWKSVVITAAAQPEGGSANGVTVRYCKPLPTTNDLYRAFRVEDTQARAGEASVNAEAAPRDDHAAGGLLRRLRREASIALALPDVGRGWILRAALQARSLIRGWPPDVVVSSGPPHSAHVATWLATRGTRAPWFIDLRDPWAWPKNKMWELSKMYDSPVFRRMDELMERSSIQACEGVITNSRWLATAVASRYPVKKVACLSNGFDPQSIPADRPQPFPGLGITHVGTVYGNRDLVPVVEALAVFLERNPSARSDGTKLRIAGAVEPSRLGGLERVVRDKGLEKYVELLGVVPRAEALGILLRSRLCLVLAQGQVIEIPGKLYEAIGAGVAAAIVAPKGSACAAEAERVGAIFVDELNTGALVKAFEGVAAGEFGVSDELAARVSYAHVAREFLDIVGAGRQVRRIET